MALYNKTKSIEATLNFILRSDKRLQTNLWTDHHSLPTHPDGKPFENVPGLNHPEIKNIK